MIVINKKIEGKTYTELIKYACLKNNIVMLAFYKKNTKKLEDTLLPFQKYILKQTDKSSNGLIYRPGMFIVFYRLNDDLQKYLLSNQSLYKWDFPDYPTDISFFKDGICWLNSITHEEICDIYVESEEEFNYLKSIGIVFLEKNYRKIAVEENIIEII